MKSYSKAYPLAELRRFPGWAAAATPAERALADEEFGYLGEDLVVLADPIREEGVLFSEGTPEWREFCASVLGFEVPFDLARAETDQA
ncbi:hypothetical protein [Streptomyces sp. CB01881]|uniref:hypothetical protein n=1 Tax=Streptomyces sp. CB01881 TaxID=2078691 RepID=UPI000CDCD37F|nr:hypothetical protein [Streptomyces sp. CB01881]AUY52514.1 hypothetical protein C2142_30400 [Streptomyces sp. CB01881]TYC70231.1 hypothetical protein EH183_30465 [Streptomyces sp. CB01881]